jgi:hypothetical protein
MLPLWADILILAALPVLVLAAVWIGDEKPDNMVVHHSDDPPDSSDEDDAPGLLIAA